MRWMLLAASAVIGVALWLPSHAAPPTDQPATAKAADEPITFEQYRDWRNRLIEQRQAQLAARLGARDLAASQRSRLEQQKAYYDWFAGLSPDDRDHRFRDRFDQIDANHDGTIDAAERAVWHDKQRAYYDRSRSGRQQAASHDPQ